MQCDSDLMLARRIRRDVQERGRRVEGVLEQYGFVIGTGRCLTDFLRYLRFVKPAYDNFVGPSSKFADIVCDCLVARYNFLTIVKDSPWFRECRRYRSHIYTYQTKAQGTICPSATQDSPWSFRKSTEMP